MSIRYIKTDRPFVITIDITGDTAILSAHHRDARRDPCAGQNEVVSVVNGNIPRGWARADLSHTCDSHSGGYASVKLIKP